MGENVHRFFIPEGERLNADGYIELLKKVKSWADARFGEGGSIFTQDGTKPHTAKKMTAWLSQNMPRFWGPDK